MPKGSFNRSENGRPPVPSRRYTVHSLQPGLGVLQSSPGYLYVRHHNDAIPARLDHLVVVVRHIEALIDEGGEITVGAAHGIECAATAADPHNALVMLVRREGESITALLKRLDQALGRYYETGETVDEINAPED